MRFGMLAAGMLAAAAAGMAHGERENPGPSPVIPQAGALFKERVAGVCRAIDYRPELGEGEGYWEDSGGGLGPESVARTYLVRHENRSDVYPPLEAVEVLSQPQHGVVKLGTNAAGTPQYNYVPDINFIGKDKVTFRVTTSVGVVAVQYYLVVTNKGADGETGRRLCDKATKQPNSTSGWRISSSLNNWGSTTASRVTAGNNWGQTTVSCMTEAYRHD